MTIWVTDYCKGSVTKFVLTQEREKELEEKFGNDVGSFLIAHQKEMGISLENVSFLKTDDRKLNVVLF